MKQTSFPKEINPCPYVQAGENHLLMSVRRQNSLATDLKCRKCEFKFLEPKVSLWLKIKLMFGH